jgi:hypothetical protein
VPSITLGTILKLLVWSLLVGAFLAFLDLSPQDVVGWAVDWGREFLRDIQFYTGRAISYVLLGAVIVVPLWLLGYLWRAMKN